MGKAREMRSAIHSVCLSAIVITFLIALPLSTRAGEFLYPDGGLCGGAYSGHVTVSGDSGSFSDTAFGDITAEYPGHVTRIQVPYPSVSDSEAAGLGVCDLHHSGWASAFPSAFIPEIGKFIPYGEVEFGMSADVFAWATLKTNHDDLDFSVDGSGGPAYVESITSPDGFYYELGDNIDFDEEPGDYVRVSISMTAAMEVTVNGVQQGPDYFGFRTSLDSEVIGTGGFGGGDSFLVLRNDEVVWEAGVDGDFDPTANITIDARYGDTIAIAGGVVARADIDSLRLNHIQGANENWNASVEISLDGSMSLINIQGSKATKALPPDFMSPDPRYYFDPIDLTEKIDELGIDDPLWFMAPNTNSRTGEHIPGYLVEIDGSVLTGVEFADIGDGCFDVFIFDDEEGEFVLYEEDWSSQMLLTLPDEIDSFIVMGFEEVDDFFSPFHFTSPIGLLFDPQSYPSVTITPLPEPATPAIFAFGALTLWRKRRK